jgi:uncharacterized protein YcbK (DUF882 family)
MSNNFNYDNFNCKDKVVYPSMWIHDRLDRLIEQLEIIRKAAGDKPIFITSGYRTPAHNKKVKGASGSYHTKGVAADIKHATLSPTKLYLLIQDLIQNGLILDGGLGLYSRWVHYDIRTILGFGRARWKG